MQTAKKPAWKSFLRILLVLMAMPLVLLIFAKGCVELIAYNGKKAMPEMTPGKARGMFASVGGVVAINQEAGILLGQLGTTDWRFLYPADLTNAPAISRLFSVCENYSGKSYSGTSMEISTENGRHIEVKFGNHWSLKRIYIFDPNGAISFNASTDCFQIASNIFATK
jgi:hypothetical protein